MTASLKPIKVKASEARIGDRLDAAGKSRVAATHAYQGKVLHRVQTRGARSPSVASYDNPSEVITVYRPA